MCYLQGLQMNIEKSCENHYEGLNPKLCRTQPEAILLLRGKLFPNWYYVYLCDLCVITPVGCRRERLQEMEGRRWDSTQCLSLTAFSRLSPLSPPPLSVTVWRFVVANTRSYFNRITLEHRVWRVWMMTMCKYYETFVVWVLKSIWFNQKN